MDIMLDLETFGHTPDSVIVQIGACYFNRNTGFIGDQILMNVDAVDGIDHGMKITAETMYWWLQQRLDARNSIISGDKFSLQRALMEFDEFVKEGANIWSHSTFDMVILMENYRNLGIKPKFDYRNSCDIRTLVNLANIDVDSYDDVGIKHNALSDCLFQVKYVVDGLRKLGL